MTITTDELDADRDRNDSIQRNLARAMSALHLTLDGPRDWRDDAHCRDLDPNLMQPEVATPDEVLVAVKVCDDCPVRDMCRALAEAQPGAYGVHAGEWFGPAPRLDTVVCAWCNEAATYTLNGPARVYCSDRCKADAKMARRAAVLRSARVVA